MRRSIFYIVLLFAICVPSLNQISWREDVEFRQPRDERLPESSRREELDEKAWEPVFVDKREKELLYEADRSAPASPDPALLKKRLALSGFKLGDPVFIRIFKEEHVLEVWMKRSEQFERFVSYPICTWSGHLGPKLQEGDRQAPEGFYTVSRGQLNPNSQYHLSFNLGYPNRFDKAHERTGSFLMVHGNCVSIGCYAMTDPVITEIWTLITKAFDKGQKRFSVHAYPFRMTDDNMADNADNPWVPFWEDLKVAYDLFETSKVPPIISVCDKRYQVARGVAGYDGRKALGKRCLRNQVQRPGPGDNASRTAAR